MRTDDSDTRCRSADLVEERSHDEAGSSEMPLMRLGLSADELLLALIVFEMDKLGSEIYARHAGRADQTTAALSETRRVNGKVDELRLTVELRALLRKCTLDKQRETSGHFSIDCILMLK